MFPIVWKGLEDGKHDTLANRQGTWHPILDLLKKTANAMRLRVVRPRHALLLESEQFRLASILPLLSAADRDAVRDGSAVPEPIIMKHAHEIHAAVRGLHYATHARIAEQRDISANGKTTRNVFLKWGRPAGGALNQLRKLERAATSTSPYKWDKALLALTDDARRYLRSGVEQARKLGALRGFAGELERPGAILLASVPTREFALVAIPHALLLASRIRRPPQVAKDVALAAILDIFLMTTRPREIDRGRGAYAALLKEGRDFVREVERIFGVALLPADEERALKRARPLMKFIPRRSSRATKA